MKMFKIVISVCGCAALFILGGVTIGRLFSPARVVTKTVEKVVTVYREKKVEVAAQRQATKEQKRVKVTRTEKPTGEVVTVTEDQSVTDTVSEAISATVAEVAATQVAEKKTVKTEESRARYSLGVNWQLLPKAIPWPNEVTAGVRVIGPVWAQVSGSYEDKKHWAIKLGARVEF